MKQIHFFLTIFLIMNSWACRNHNIHTDDPMVQSVMDIHDAVMPEMATIHALKRQLKSIELESADDSTLVYQQIKQLDDADEGMMAWMAAFKVPDEKEIKESYLKNEKLKIQKVSDDMISAISAAEELIENLKKKNN